MRVVWNIFMVLALMAGAGAVGFFIGHRAVVPAESADSGDSGDADSIQPVPTVQTAPMRRDGSIAKSSLMGWSPLRAETWRFCRSHSNRASSESSSLPVSDWTCWRP